uniref:Uncharacterized protein LOC104243448 isoform X1 n=1 Tax=Nicotiana sylvestris TaxID=4096 RepID=A0A1U7XY88_NICSY|nr:PREDICTED: uncharacterized protein LOC104243448 isoform X1 [Nicotiana sylvestris]
MNLVINMDQSLDYARSRSILSILVVMVQKPHSQKLTLNKTKRSPLVCKYCKKTGHLIDKCFNGCCRYRRTIRSTSKSSSAIQSVTTFSGDLYWFCKFCRSDRALL